MAGWPQLGQGVDFSPLFSEKDEDFEKEDMDPEQEQILGAFERTLARAHGWCAVAKAQPTGTSDGSLQGMARQWQG